MQKRIWAPLAEGRQIRTYSPGQLIYLQGAEPHDFYYLIEGTARSFISSPGGGERLLTLHKAGDLMGEASFFDECPRVSSAMAVSECKAVSIDRANLDRVFRAHPDLALPMLRYLARTVRMLSGHVNDITFRPADKRLARALLDRADDQGTVHATHEELGTAVGTSRVTVSRVLSQFAANSWVERGYGTLRITDRKALEGFMETD